MKEFKEFLNEGTSFGNAIDKMMGSIERIQGRTQLNSPLAKHAIKMKPELKDEFISLQKSLQDSIDSIEEIDIAINT